MEPFSLHQELELHQAMPEPQVLLPNPLLWLEPLPLVLVFLAAAGATCVKYQTQSATTKTKKPG